MRAFDFSAFTAVETTPSGFLERSEPTLLILPPNLKTISANAFNNATLNINIEFPEGFTSTKGGNCFWDIRGNSTVIFPSSTTSLAGGGNFAYIRFGSPKFIVLALTPPRIDKSSYISSASTYKTQFYVPDAAFEAYKQADVWSDYYSYGRVHPLSELEN